MWVTDSDAMLSERARRGDSDAFGTLVERYMRRTYVHALGIVGSREDALDLSQEAFARAYRARHTLDPSRPFYAWLYQILRRVCFNYLRDAKTRARLTTAEQAEWLVPVERHAGLDPAAATLRLEVQERVAQALSRLPAREREVLVLKEFEGLKYREIAEALNVPIGTVMSRLYAARKRLADVLETLR